MKQDETQGVASKNATIVLLKLAANDNIVRKVPSDETITLIDSRPAFTLLAHGLDSSVARTILFCIKPWQQSALLYLSKL